MNPVEYVLWLDDLNRLAALYVWTNGQHDGTAITFTLPRDIWEQMDRPTKIKVEVTA